jgi:tetratricopeptide (TPR) repeat protein
VRLQSLSYSLSVLLLAGPAVYAAPRDDQQRRPSELVRVVPPQIQRAEPPAPTAPAEELESRGDQLRGQKAYLDALDYYHSAIAKKPKSAELYNKAGVTELELRHLKESRKDFEHAVKLDRQFSVAYNNLGVVHYEEQQFGKAIKLYEKAIQLNQDVASYYSNLGAAY